MLWILWLFQILKISQDVYCVITYNPLNTIHQCPVNRSRSNIIMNSKLIKLATNQTHPKFVGMYVKKHETIARTSQNKFGIQKNLFNSLKNSKQELIFQSFFVFFLVKF